MRIEGECHAPVPEFLEHYVRDFGSLMGFYDGTHCKTFIPMPIKIKL